MKSSNPKARELLNQIKALDQNATTRALKNGLRNVLVDCREVGSAAGGALKAAERYLRVHEPVEKVGLKAGSFREIIAARMTELGINSGYALAKKLNHAITVTAIDNYLSGSSQMTAGNLELIFETLGIEIRSR